LLLEQIENINEKRQELEHMRKLLFTLLKSVQSGISADTDRIKIEFLPEEPILLGGVNDYSRGRDAYDELFRFYELTVSRADADLIYPVWGVMTEEQVRTAKSGETVQPYRYYLYTPDGEDRRPAALYAIGHMRTGYGGGGALYERMLSYIEDHGFEVCGEAYEEYPLNEVCVSDDTDYLMRLLITVRQKRT
jgi:hypothetical protein